MKVKICGITCVEDAGAAVRAGADFLGFIFARSSKRWIDPERARAIIATLPEDVTPVGVFVDAPRSEIVETIQRSGVQLIQLHGQETPTEGAGFQVPVWKAFRVRPDFDVHVLAGYQADAFLLDTYVEGMQGGTGRQFDWKIAVASKPFGRIVLSGGITPENVAAAVREVCPYAIDVSSGVESSPGRKDAGKIARLFDAIRQTKESLC
jgi:phosphoribosylanthranilate isomerase